MILKLSRALSFLPLALAGPGTLALAQTISPSIERYEAGVICPPSGSDASSLPFVTRTLVVPAVQAMSFGVQYLTTEVFGPGTGQSGGTMLFAIDFDVMAPTANDGLLRACGL